MRKRLFLAISLPKQYIDILDEYKNNFSSTSQLLWVTKENLHITLYFFGYEEEKNIRYLSTKIKSTLQKFDPFRLKFKNISLAPPDASPRMIWAVFNESQQFIEITKAVKEVKSISEKHRDYKPIPHITLARFKYLREIKNIELKQPTLGDLKVTHFNLCQSKLTPKGPIYTIIKEYKL